jgi:predicted DNA-binding protein with PD1-like motif
MRGTELQPGRTFAVVIDDGEDFFAGVTGFCRQNGIRQGYVPTFLGGFSTAEVIGTCVRIEDPHVPVRSGVFVENVEVVGGGTLAYDEATDAVLPHIHVSAGVKQYSAVAYTSHLLRAEVQMFIELVIVEATGPAMRRDPDPNLYGMPVLRFD